MQSNNKSYIIKKHNPYNTNNPVIYTPSRFSLNQIRLINEIKKEEVDTRKKLLTLEQSDIKKIFLEYGVLEVILLEQKERLNVINDQDIIINKQNNIKNKEKANIQKQINTKKEKAKSELQKNLEKTLKTKENQLVQQKHKTIEPIEKAALKENHNISIDEIISLLNLLKTNIESLKNEKLPKLGHDELTIKLNLIFSKSFYNLFTRITNYKNFSKLSFNDIFYIEYIKWHIALFKNDINTNTNLNVISDLLIKKLDSLSNSLLLHFKVNDKFHNTYKSQISILCWLNKNFDIINNFRTNKAPLKDEIETLELSLNSFHNVYLTKSKETRSSLSKMLKLIILDKITLFGLIAYQNLIINKVDLKNFWIFIIKKALSYVLLNDGDNQNAILGLLCQSCDTQNDFTTELFLEIAVKENINLNSSLADGKFNLLHLACKTGYEQMVKLLIANKVNVNHKSFENITGFHYACHEGFDKVVNLFKNSNVNINDFIQSTSPIIFKSIERNHIKVFNELLEFPDIDLNKFSIDDADTPLMFAIYNGRTDMAKKLIEKGVDVTLKNAKGIDAYQRACHLKNNQIKQLLLKVHPRFSLNDNDNEIENFKTKNKLTP